MRDVFGEYLGYGTGDSDCNYSRDHQRCVRPANTVLSFHFIHYSYKWEKLNGEWIKVHVYYA